MWIVEFEFLADVEGINEEIHVRVEISNLTSRAQSILQRFRWAWVRFRQCVLQCDALLTARMIARDDWITKNLRIHVGDFLWVFVISIVVAVCVKCIMPLTLPLHVDSRAVSCVMSSLVPRSFSSEQFVLYRLQWIRSGEWIWWEFSRLMTSWLLPGFLPQMRTHRQLVAKWREHLDRLLIQFGCLIDGG